MILIGPKLAELCVPVWGGDWKTELGRRLGLSRQTIHTKSKSKTGLPKSFKRQLRAALQDQLVATATSLNELDQDLGQP